MTLIDTSVWIDFLIGRDTSQVRAVESLVENREDICICGVVLTEVLQGIRDDKECEETKSVLSELVFIPMTPETFYTAAHIYRTCRSKGITIRNSIDCMIVATCLQHGAGLLHNDKDFDLIGSQFDLQIVEVPE
jgi:predicted nucleic acid-binding protein